MRPGQSLLALPQVYLARVPEWCTGILVLVHCAAIAMFRVAAGGFALLMCIQINDLAVLSINFKPSSNLRNAKILQLLGVDPYLIPQSCNNVMLCPILGPPAGQPLVPLEYLLLIPHHTKFSSFFERSILLHKMWSKNQN